MNWGRLRDLANQVQETVKETVLEAIEESETGLDQDDYLYEQHLQYIGETEESRSKEDINEAKRRMLNMQSYDDGYEIEPDGRPNEIVDEDDETNKEEASITDEDKDLLENFESVDAQGLIEGNPENKGYELDTVDQEEKREEVGHSTSEEYMKTIRGLRETVKEKEERLHNAENVIKTLQAEVHDLQTSNGVDESASEIKQLQKELQEKNENILTIENSLKMTQDELIRIVKESDRQIAKIQELEEALTSSEEAANQDLDFAECREMELSARVKELELQIYDLENPAVQREVQTQDEDVEKMKLELSQQSTELIEATERIRHLETALEEHSINLEIETKLREDFEKLEKESESNKEKLLDYENRIEDSGNLIQELQNSEKRLQERLEKDCEAEKQLQNAIAEKTRALVEKETELEGCAQKIENLTSSYDEIHRQLAEKSEKEETLEAEIESALASVQEKALEIESYEREVAALKLEMTRLQEEGAENDKEGDKGSLAQMENEDNRLEESMNIIKIREEEICSLNEKVEALEILCDQNSNRIEQDSSTISGLQSEIQMKEEELMEKDSTIADLQQKKEVHKQNNGDPDLTDPLLQQIDEQLEIVKEKDAMISAHEKTISERTSEITELKAKLETSETRQVEMEQKLKLEIQEKENELESERELIQSQENEIKVSASNIAELEKRVAEMKDKMEDTTKMEESSAKVIEELRTSLQDRELEMKDTVDKLRQSQDKVHALEEEVTKLTFKLTDFSKSQSALENEAKNHMKDMNEQKKLVTELELRESELKQTLEACREEIDGLKYRLHKDEEEISSLHGSLEKCKNANDEQSELAQSQEEKVGKLMEEKANLAEEISALQARIETTAIAENTMQNKVKELEKQLKESVQERKLTFEKNCELEDLLNRKIESEKELKSKMEKKHVSVMGQLDEIERLRSELSTKEQIIQNMKEGLKSSSTATQQLNRLKGELEATSADLKIAEADKKRYSMELENLNKALTNMTEGGKSRQQVYENQIQTLKTQKVALEQEVGVLRPEKERLENLVTSLNENLEALKSKSDLLSQELQTVERRMSLQSIERHSSSDEPENDTVVESDIQAKQTEGAESDMDDEIKSDVVKKLLITYFAQKQQKDILTMIANVMDMNQEERQILGLEGNEESRLGNLLAATSSSTGMLSKVLFGQNDQPRRPVDWDAVEKKVREKSFGDLFQEALSEDL